jgi:hypothetical protein
LHEKAFMADYRSDSVPFSPLTLPRLQTHPTVMTDTRRPSSVRVFGKSLYVLAAGWMLSVTWLWIAEVRQHIYRFGTRPDGLAWSTIVGGAIPAVLIALLALGFTRMIGNAASPGQDRIEWNHAFWWTLLPNLFLLATAYIMIGSAG